MAFRVVWSDMIFWEDESESGEFVFVIHARAAVKTKARTELESGLFTLSACVRDDYRTKVLSPAAVPLQSIREG